MESKAMTTKAGMTWDEFLAAGEEWQRWEYVDGEVEFMSPVFLRHQAMIFQLIAGFVKYREQHPEWLCFPGDATFVLASENWRCPDLSIVHESRFPDGKIPDAPGNFPPEIIFEIVSSRDGVRQIQRKRHDYLESGVIQVWINPAARNAEVVHPDRPAQFFTEDQPLIIDMLPDFKLNLKELFSI